MLVVKPKQAAPAAGIKDGTYRAKVSNIKPFTNNYGPRVGFEFTIQSGFDLEDLIDKEFSILVLQSKSKSGAGYSNVERVFAA